MDPLEKFMSVRGTNGPSWKIIKRLLLEKKNRYFRKLSRGGCFWTLAKLANFKRRPLLRLATRSDQQVIHVEEKSALSRGLRHKKNSWEIFPIICKVRNPDILLFVQEKIVVSSLGPRHDTGLFPAQN